jgi:hypothetical protein
MQNDNKSVKRIKLGDQEKGSKNEGFGPEEQERDQKTEPIDQKLELNNCGQIFAKRKIIIE